jgi:hypothetical protein
MVDRYIGVIQEEIFKTEPSGGIAYVDIYDEKVVPDKDLITFETAASRSYNKRTYGDFRAQGDINLPAVPDEGLGWLLKFAMGDVDSDSSGAGYVHTFQCADTIPSFTTKIGITDFASMLRTLTGVLLDTLTFKSEYLKGLDVTAKLIGFNAETKGAIGNPDVSALNPFVFAQGVYKTGGTPRAYLHGFTLNVANNIPADKWFNKVHVGKRKVDGTITLVFDETTEYDRFLTGDPFSLDIAFTGALIGGSTYYYLRFYLPVCVFLKDVTPHINKREMCIIDAPFQAFYDPTYTELQIELLNATDSYPDP